MGYSAEVLADTPLAYWRLDDPSGTTVSDASGNSHTGTYTASPTLGVASLIAGDADTAVTFDGSSQLATIAHAAWMDNAAFTIEFWFKTTQTGTVRVMVTRHGAASSEFQITMTSGAITFTTFNVNTGSTVATSSGTYNDGLVHHLVATYASGTGTLYIDNVSIGSTGSLTVTTSATGGITLAAREGPTFLFACTLDEVAYYSTALSAARVTAHYLAGKYARSAIQNTRAALQRAATR